MSKPGSFEGGALCAVFAGGVLCAVVRVGVVSAGSVGGSRKEAAGVRMGVEVGMGVVGLVGLVVVVEAAARSWRGW